MDAILQKLNEANELLKVKIETVEKKQAENEAIFEGNVKKSLELKKREQELDSRELSISYIEDVAKEKSLLSEIKKEQSKKEAELNQKQVDLAKLEQKLTSDTAEIENMKKIYAQKDANLEEAKKQLEIEKKNLKEKVLEEIKGKL